VGFIGQALARFNPAFDETWVRETWLFTPRSRCRWSSRHVPDKRPFPMWRLASMSQGYPWDRGTNFAVEIGRRNCGQLLGH
jgi:hypothetical protein